MSVAGRFLLFACGSLLSPLAAQGSQATPPLDPGVAALVEESLTQPAAAGAADRLWQRTCAVHGEIEPLVRVLRQREGAGAARLLCGVLRYEGRPEQALAVLQGLDAETRTDDDLLLRAELLDAIGREHDAAKAYEQLLTRELAPALRRRILFRRALVGSDSIDQLKQFARADGNDRDQRNQAAIILALRGEPAAALELYEVHGEGTARFRQLVRLAEWAIAAEQFDRAAKLAWQGVECAKVRRDRRYALTVVVSACRAGDTVDELLQRFEQTGDLDKDARQVWIDLLRDEGRVDDALRLFRAEGEGQWTPALRRQLLEICRETGREDVLVAQFRELLTAEPRNLEWRGGLSRHYLESGERERARAVWSDYGDGCAPGEHLDAAYSLMELGLDDLALQHADAAARDERLRETAMLFVVKLHVARGHFDEAEQRLRAIEDGAEDADAVLAEVAGIYERIDRLDRAVAVLGRMRDAHGGFLGTDLDMKYALLLSKVDREQDALDVWRSLWTRVRSTPRGRYVEDRMMTVAARLGVLAKIAIELEDKLDAGQADPVDVELLVRLYIKVGDSAAATEITEQALQGAAADDLEIIRKKATIYLACHDYLEYEQLIEQLVERDPENRLEHMRELTLSRLERGRRAQAIEKLPTLRAASDDGGIADEFEAGIYQLAGLNERALKSYTKGLGRFPDRIDTHLLVANLMRETGREMEAARRFQYLASTAARDDLFTIAIDGILNLRAQQDTRVPDEVVDWAMRVTLERLAERPHRFYLHRLAADLAEERNDMPLSIRTLTAGIPVAGERRTALLREILGKVRSLDKNARTMFGGSRAMRISEQWDAEPYVRIGRRLLGQGEVVPPQVFMDLAAVFLHVDAVPDAMRTFARAADLLDRSEVHRQAAAVLEGAGHYDAALQFYRRLLSVEVGDVTLLAKIGRLEEFAGRDEIAARVYRRGLDAALRQTPQRVHVASEQEPDPDDLQGLFGGERNVDAVAAALPRFVEGLLVTLDHDDAGQLIEQLGADVESDLVAIGAASDDEIQTIDSFPRLQARALALRRLALCFARSEVSEAVDAQLLQRFSTDRELAKLSIGYRAKRGFHLAARRVLRGSRFVDDPDFAWLLVEDVPDNTVTPAIAASRVLPLLANDPQELRAVLDRVDTAALDVAGLASVPMLLGACVLVDAKDAGERISRAAVRLSASLGERQRFAGRIDVGAVIGLAARIDAELEGRLWQYRAERSAARGAKALSSLEYGLAGRKIEIDAQRVEQLLRSEVANSGQEQFGLRGMNLLGYIPADARAPLLRELYTAAPRSQRMRVLSDGADHLVEPIDDGFVEWYAGTFAREYADADESARRSAGGGYVRTPDASLRLQRVRLEVALAAGGSHREWLRLLAVVTELGDRDAAQKLLRDGIPAMVVRDDVAGLVPGRAKRMQESQVDATVDRIEALGLLQAASDLVDERLAAQPKHVALRYMQWQLRTRAPGAAAFVEQVAADHPEDTQVLERVAGFLRARARLVEAGEVLQRLVDIGGERQAHWRAELARVRRQLGSAQVGDDADAKPAADQPAPGSAAALLVASGFGNPRGRLAKVTDEQDPAKARLALRRVWRTTAGNGVVYSPSVARANVSLNPRELRSLRGKTFAADEARRVLRLLVDAGQLGSGGLLPGVQQLLPAAERSAEAVPDLLAALADGRGGAAESILLQSLLENDGDELPDELRTRIVNELLVRREVPDKQRLRVLAAGLARLGRQQAAARLHRLAVLVHAGNSRFAPRVRSGAEPAKQLASLREQLGGELARRTALAWLDDQLAIRPSPALMLAAVQAWPELLPADELPRRVAALHSRCVELRTDRFGPGRDPRSARLAAALCEQLVASGQFEPALEELQQLALVPEPDMFGRVSPRIGHIADEAIAKLCSGSPDRDAAWLRAMGQAVIAWQQQGRLAAAPQTLGTVGTALASAGERELAATYANALAELAPDDSHAEQQLAHLYRALGDDNKAFAIEHRLLRQRRLAIADHARVVAEVAREKGAQAAFAAGERALTYTRDLALLERLASLADELGQADRAAELRSELDERKPKPQPEAKPAAPAETGSAG